MATVPQWKALLREAQASELKAARLRVQRLRALRAAENLTKQSAKKTTTDSIDTFENSTIHADADQTATNDKPASGVAKKKPLGESKLSNIQKRTSTTSTTGVKRAADDDTQLDASASKRRAAMKQTSDRVYATLKTLKSLWTERISALEEIGSSALVIDTRLARALSVQLLDLRSKVVVATAEAICKRANSFSLPDAVHIATAALDGVAVNKAVMSQARARAFAAAMAPHGLRFDAWEFLLEHLGKHQAERARAACARAVAVWAPNTAEKLDPLLAAALRTALEDSRASVREEGKNLWNACTPLGVERCNKIKNDLGNEAAVRLPGANTNKRSSVRDIMRQRRAHAPRTSTSKSTPDE